MIRIQMRKTEYDLRTCPPSDLSKQELGECIDLVASGNAVDPQSARRGLPKAVLIAVVRTDGKIVGVGAIKRTRPEYASDKAVRSGVTFCTTTLELGYVCVAADHQRKGLSGRIVESLTQRYTRPLFATTSSPAMKKTLRSVGFVKRGCEWEGNSGVMLSLWLKKGMIQPVKEMPLIEPDI
jgi:GNAT superfamily N-acetyltransferase